MRTTTGFLAAASLAALLGAAAGPAPAQTRRADWGVGIAAGAALPGGDASTTYKTGGSANAFILFPVSWGPSLGLGVRGDLHGTLMNAKPFDSITGEVRVVAWTGSLVLGLEAGNWRPFLAGGAGRYSLRFRTRYGEYEETENEDDFGWSAGGGVAWQTSSVTLFLEVRYHRVSFSRAPFVMVPVSLGVAF